MSWSVMFYDLQAREIADIPVENIERIQSQHPEYLSDMIGAFELAKKVGLNSGTITGMRTPSPYGDDEVVDVSVRGVMKAKDFNAEMQRMLRAGPGVEGEA